MITEDNKPKVLEFNCRLGDPETQVILPRLQSDFVELCLATVRGELNSQLLIWDPRPAVGIVAASKGYPDDYLTGQEILGLSENRDDDIKIFHAGTRINEQEKIVTHGGRVLCVTALADNIESAQQKAYAALATIHWKDRYYRRDIASRAS